MQLAELPEGLDKIYNRILKNISKKHRADTRTFLQWLAFCKRPMKIEDIAETITADFSNDYPVFNWDKWYADPRDVLVRCSSFISELESEGHHWHCSTWQVRVQPSLFFSLMWGHDYCGIFFVAVKL